MLLLFNCNVILCQHSTATTLECRLRDDPAEWEAVSLGWPRPHLSPPLGLLRLMKHDQTDETFLFEMSVWTLWVSLEAKLPLRAQTCFCARKG